ncbi:hypothetical protein [Peterkaempfera sp. SMS 1(5)a]|uniref:hypothetical protein n=1 Tax=Peterkaempfera podocarpi TaxID=3232308 RepID=UPI00366EB03E
MALYSDDQQPYYRVRGENTVGNGANTVTLFIEDGSSGPLNDTIRTDVVDAIKALLGADPAIRVTAYATNPVQTDL